MKKTCPKCKGTGSFIVDTKECEVCGGTGYEDNSFEMKGHFKGVNSKAAAKFDLDADQDVPCEACKEREQSIFLKNVRNAMEQVKSMSAENAEWR